MLAPNNNLRNSSPSRSIKKLSHVLGNSTYCFLINGGLHGLLTYFTCIALSWFSLEERGQAFEGGSKLMAYL